MVMKGDGAEGEVAEGAEVGEAAGVKGGPAPLKTSTRLSSSSKHAAFSQSLSSASIVGELSCLQLMATLVTL